jgi:hypothetical protein
MAEALKDISGGGLEYVPSPKLLSLEDRLREYGYNPYEYLVYFVDKYEGKGGLSNLRIQNIWTSDIVWVAFLDYKKIAKECTPRWYTIQMNDVRIRLNNDLSTKVDILTTDITSANLLVKMDLAFEWFRDYEEVRPFMKDSWERAMIQIKGWPEYLHHTKYTTEYLINQGNVEYVI